MARSLKRFAQWLPPHSGAASRSKRSMAVSDKPAIQAIWNMVCAIPRGQVSTYGAVARAAGLAGRARLTGFALKAAPAATYLPWHRVVGAGGRIVFPKTSLQHKEQSQRLRAEGVLVKNGRVARAFITNLEDL
jgi:methylated-DNA-protein-cysteine methyltransferase related protein